ncbi:MAG: hemolysin family protein [Treponema sp.]|nr:hemolysin family protein [Treponema sp.]
MDSHFTALIFYSLAMILLSGVFSLFDYALAFCRKSRLEKERGAHYKAVLDILENSNNLSLACRLWINILRILASFFAGIYTISLFLLNNFRDSYSVLAAFIALYVLITGIMITLFSDALPRMLSRTKPEKIASFLLPVMKILSVPVIPFTLPVIKFASFFSRVFRPEITDNSITEEELQDELRNTLMEGEKSGIVESKERTMVEGVFYLGDRSVAAFMTHRSEIQWLDINDTCEEVRKKAIEYRKQRCFPVVNASPDEIVGAVFLEDIILEHHITPEETAGGVLKANKWLRAIMKKAQFVPETMPAIKAFESFKQGQSDFLFVMDEYGGLAGIISITALVEEIVGEFSASAASEEPLIRQEDGAWLADGTLNIDDAVKALSLTGLGEEGDFHTLAGLILHLAGELPRVGDSFEYQGYLFKVTEKDGNRINKLLIKKIDGKKS